MRNQLIVPLLAFGALLLVGIAAQSAEARQTSIDAQLVEAFENIDRRVTNHEVNVVEAKARLEELALEVEQHRSALANLPSDATDANVRSQKRLHHAKLIQSTAMYLNQQFRLADAAATVISENLSELAALAKAIPSSVEAQNSANQIQASKL